MLISGRGKKGGYRLARKPSEYTIGSILKLTEKTLAPVNCLEGGKVTCEKAGYCITLPMWQKLVGIGISLFYRDCKICLAGIYDRYRSTELPPDLLYGFSGF